MTMYPFIMNDASITIIIDGKSHTINNKHVSFTKIKEAIKNNDFRIIKQLIDVKVSINTYGEGLVTIEDGVISYKGQPMHNALTRRMLTMMSEGFSIDPLVKFLENVMLNPSYRAVTELYGFLEKNNLPITDNGTFLAYKKIRNDWKDIYSGKIDNSIGTTVEMIRNSVDDNCARTCSSGLHFCSLDYLPNYSGDLARGNRVVILEINPADVVSIPVDYNNSKGRCCKYKVVDDVTSQSIDYLKNKPVHEGYKDEDPWDDEDEENWDGDSGFYDDDDDDDEDYDDILDDSLDLPKKTTRSETLKTVMGILNEFTMGDLPENISERTTLDDLSFDSLDVVELAMSVEEEFGVDLPDYQIDKMKNIGQLVDFLTNEPSPNDYKPSKFKLDDDDLGRDDEYDTDENAC